jgi:sialic acid synthase SpsE
MRIGNYEIGKRSLIVAEIGTNHNGDFALAQQMLQEAADAGADAVKFQTFNPDRYVHKGLSIFSLAKGSFKTQYERVASVQLSYEQFRELKAQADRLGVIFLSTPFDEDAVDFLEALVPVFKVASGDITNTMLLKHIATKGKGVILSTGMASEQEIQDALDLFPRDQLILLHCVARYPTSLDEANLLSIPYLQDKFGVPVGYSDHTEGTTACRIAACLGAVIIEKHFTLDKSQQVGDHRLSMDSRDLMSLVRDVQDIEKARGIYGRPIAGQIQAARVMRRSLYAKIDIAAGELISQEMIVALRPADGLSPKEYENVVGKKAKVRIKKDTLLTKEMFE